MSGSSAMVRITLFSKTSLDLQLTTLIEVGNLITDIMLVVLPFPVLLAVRTRWQKYVHPDPKAHPTVSNTAGTRRKAQLCSLFSIGFFLIAISIVRIVQSFPSARIQFIRTLWGSLETVFATIVAQVPTLYTLLRRDAQHSSYTANTYRLTSSANHTSRVKSGFHPNYQSSERESQPAFDQNWKSFRAEVFTGDVESSRTPEIDGESESTKGILVTVDVTQVVRTDSTQGKDQDPDHGN